MAMDRRGFLKAVGTGFAGVAGATFPMRKVMANEQGGSAEFMGVLADTTRCAGCRTCELTCAETNGLPAPEITDADFERERKTSVTQYTVVNRYNTEQGEVFVKKQCMHCNQPGCASACLVKAMQKRKEGPVTWDTNCIGCRFCMVSCPYDIPKFEYDSANPKVQKCSLCWEKRVKNGQPPACVEACPGEALFFGTRRAVIDEAYKRIYTEPKKYVHHIYGENEAGGSSWLYLSAVPFEQIGFKTDIGTTPYPTYSASFLYAVPIILILWPPLLTAMSRITKREQE